MRKTFLTMAAVATLLAVPSLASADEAVGAVTGAAAGAATGAVIGGPVGAVVGGVAGATIGGAAGATGSGTVVVQPEAPKVIERECVQDAYGATTCVERIR
ncbi:hypothetical protein [Prosthecodimorpha staleyi]|uniref:Glycine zipper domain-containing protein n=1 Tax=Prosthecodimorpha staleyi TaxID=2840188 RepID=A0A947GGL7_9HYPH|nr:hypothetical protein [Prosthecodimorpha staleyi]MBT9292445.1 hypothetical protein [Prosthecodimorpha staleyi]